MRKICLFAAAVASLAMLAGCAGMQISEKANLNGEKLATEGKTVAHISADNWGLYLFMIPLITGSAEEKSQVVLLQDTVNATNMVNMISKKSAKMGGTTICDVTSRIQANGWMFYFKQVQVSANVLK